MATIIVNINFTNITITPKKQVNDYWLLFPLCIKYFDILTVCTVCSKTNFIRTVSVHDTCNVAVLTNYVEPKDTKITFLKVNSIQTMWV